MDDVSCVKSVTLHIAQQAVGMFWVTSISEKWEREDTEIFWHSIQLSTDFFLLPSLFQFFFAQIASENLFSFIIIIRNTAVASYTTLWDQFLSH